jgi:hypothetical protein
MGGSGAISAPSLQAKPQALVVTESSVATISQLRPTAGDRPLRGRPSIGWLNMPPVSHERTLGAAAPIPLAAWRIRRIRAGDHRDPECWPAVTFWAVALLVLTSAAELLAALWLRSRG